MSDYDNTNSGVVFAPWPDSRMAGQGKININGKDNKVIMVHEKLSANGNPVRCLYERVAVLFDNDKKGNDGAPDYSGPIDTHHNLRIAGWSGEKDGKPHLSLKITEKLSAQGQEQGNASQAQAPAPSKQDDDFIPF